MEYTKEQYLQIYGWLYFSRRYEELSIEYMLAGKGKVMYHLATGEEAVSIGIYSVLGEDDWLVPHFRARPMIALRYGLRDFAAEVHSRSNAPQLGLAGGSHFMHFENRVMIPSAMIGQPVAYGAGIALSMKMDKKPGCVVIGVGDGGLNEGVVFETLNMIAAWKLPVAFYIQNNSLSISTDHSAATGLTNLADRAKGYGLPSASYDGNDVFLVAEVMREAVERARCGEPSVTEFFTTRWEGHFYGDPSVYRNPAVVEKAKEERDGVKNNRNFLLGNHIAAEKELLAVEMEQERLIRDSFDYAFESPELTRDEVRDPKLVWALEGTK